MADLQRTIEIIFNGVDDVSGTMSTISGKMSKFGDTVSGIGDPFANVAKGVIALDAALTAMVAGGAVYAVNKFAEFEDVMLKVKGVIGASESDYQRLTDVTKDLGATTRYTATEAAEGLEFLALAGMKTDDAIGALPAVLQLAQASATDLGQTADIVTNIMAGYGIEVKDLVKTNDILTATFTNSNTNLEQLGQAFKFVGPVAKSLGFDIEETAATLGILGNAGYQAEMGGTALRNIMIALVAPAGNMGKLMKELGVDTSELGVDFADSRNALDSLGVTIKDSNGNMLPFTKILDQIKKGLEQIPDPADRTATLIEIFGKRGGPQMAALLEQGTGAIEGLKEKIGSLGGVTQKIADDMESGMGGAQRAMSSALEAITLSIGEEISKGVKPALYGIVDVFRAVADEVADGNSFDAVFNELQGVGTKIEQYFKDIAQSIPAALDLVDYDRFIASLKNLSSSFENLFDGIDLTTPEGLADAIQTVIDSLSSLNNITAGMIDFASPVIDLISELVDWFNELSPQAQELAGFIVGLGASLTTLGGILGVGGILVGGIGNLAGLFGSSGALITGITAAKTALSTLAATPSFQLTASFTIGWAIGGQIRELSGGAVDEWMQGIFRSIDSVINFTGQMGDVDLGEFGDKKLEIEIQAKTDKAKASLNDFFSGIDDFEVEVRADLQVEQSLTDFFSELDSWEGNYQEVLVKAEADETSLTDTKTELERVGTRADGSPIYAEITAKGKDIDKVKKDIDAIPSEKLLEIKLQGEIDTQIAQIEAQAETAQTYFEWNAQLQIADIQASSEQAIAFIDNIGDSVTALADSTASMFDSLLSNWNDLNIGDQWAFMDILEEQQEAQNRALESQIKLNEAQIEFMKDKTRAMSSGDGLIKIDSTGLEPALEMIMWEILEKVQIRATEESADFLLGLNGT